MGNKLYGEKSNREGGERMSGFNKVLRKSSLRRCRRKDLKKGREQAMRACREESRAQTFRKPQGWPGLGTARSIHEPGVEKTMKDGTRTLPPRYLGRLSGLHLIN